jgi:hypothetical protein
MVIAISTLSGRCDLKNTTGPPPHQLHNGIGDTLVALAREALWATPTPPPGRADVQTAAISFNSLRVDINRVRPASLRKGSR